MTSLPVALIISDYPILATTARTVFATRYTIVTRTWSEFVEQVVPDATMVIVDVTTVSTGTALALLRSHIPEAQVVVCSLHRNEVEVCRIGRQGVTVERALPSLLALAA